MQVTRGTAGVGGAADVWLSHLCADPIDQPTCVTSLENTEIVYRPMCLAFNDAVPAAGSLRRCKVLLGVTSFDRANS